jgi:hypothetical protein
MAYETTKERESGNAGITHKDDRVRLGIDRRSYNLISHTDDQSAFDLPLLETVRKRSFALQ